MNAEDLPPFVTSTQLKSGKVSWYWSPPTRDRKAGCPLPATPLGSDFASAMERAGKMNQALQDWRQSREPGAMPANFGSFDWLCGIYRQDRRYRELQAETKQGYETALDRFGNYKLKNGQRLGSYPLDRLTPQTVDAVYDKLRSQGLTRQAALCMDVCRKAWKIARRRKPDDVPSLNPFEAMDIDRTRAETVPASHDQLVSFCEMAVEMGWPQMAFAARACWDLLQRPIDVFDRRTWADWRPSNRPGETLVTHNKNRRGETRDEWTPLEGVDPQTGETVVFYPELERFASLLEVQGTLMLMRPRKRGRQTDIKVWDPFPKRFREQLTARIAKAAGLPAGIGMRNFRHGGLTELGDAGLPDTWAQALSRHKQRTTLDTYIHRTTAQKQAGTLMRIEHRRSKS